MKKLIIVDISGFIYRAFYAIRPLHAPDGTPVNAVSGVLSMMLKLLSKYQPSHIVLARDTRGGSFRNEVFSEYKANRSEPPDDLIAQFGLIEELISKMNLPNIAIEKYEADDIIGSIAVQWKNKFDEVLIASGDKDLMQFVDEKIKMLDTMKDIIYGPNEVFEKMRVRPDQIVDYLSIVGDTSDNIPGMKGIGAKGAAKLLEEHGTLDNCIKVKDSLKGKKLINAFENHLDDALLSKELIQIVTDLELNTSPTDTKFTFYPTPELIEFLKELGFKTVLKKLQDIAYSHHQAEKNDEEGSFKVVDTSAPLYDFSHEQVSDIKKIESFIKDEKRVALHVSYNDLYTEVKSITLSVDGKKSYIIQNKKEDLLDPEIPEEQLLHLLSSIWKDSSREVFSDHTKQDRLFYLNHNKEIKAKLFDITQAHFVIDPTSSHKLPYIISSFLKHDMGEAEEEKAACLFLLKPELEKKLKELELEKVYQTIDAPLLNVLAHMEHNGIRLNPNYLKKLEKEFQARLDEIETEITKEAGESINLRSPKQVSTLLFETLQLPVIKKTKTGFSTDSEVLEELDSMGESSIPGMILQYREYEKILSTYIKALPGLINPQTGKIHTEFNQHTAATGRLSSLNPNLQNIPVRSPKGKLIRKAFIATPGKILLSADYSQVELRILAHFSEDTTMLNSFLHNVDIHTQTAAEVLGVPVDKVTSEERSHAKAVNFGLMYGQSSFGLSKALKISRHDAKEYITKYFERFSQVKSFLDSLKESCEELDFAKTFHGRKRYIPEIHSSNRNIKNQAERVAVNSPIQGTAADIIKIAMINIYEQMKKKKLKSKMLLQVHDELIFEVEEDEIETMKTLVQTQMESVVDFKVPLSVDMGTGVNWYDLK